MRLGIVALAGVLALFEASPAGAAGASPASALSVDAAVASSISIVFANVPTAALPVADEGGDLVRLLQGFGIVVSVANAPGDANFTLGARIVDADRVEAGVWSIGMRTSATRFLQLASSVGSAEHREPGAERVEIFAAAD